MARLTEAQKEEIVSRFRVGISQNQLAKEYNVSPATINKYCKGLDQDYKDKVNAVSHVKTELANESEYLVNAFEDEVNSRTKHLIYFQNSALKNQKLANELLDGADSLNELEAHSRITQRNKETVLGKDKTVELNNTNAQQNNETKVIQVEYK